MTTGEYARAVGEIWTELLGVDPIGPRDDFFALGGQSVSAARMLARVRRRLGADLTVAEVFRTPVFEDLVRRVAEQARQRRPSGAAGARPAEPGLSHAQRRMWFASRYTGSAYHIPLVFRLTGRLDPVALRAALRHAVARHEVLRTRYLDDDGAPVPVVEPVDRFHVGLARVAPDDLDPWLRTEVRREFDLATGLPIRATLVRVGRDDHVLCVVLHHVAADGWSLGVFTDEVSRAYPLAERAALPEPAPMSYAEAAARADAAATPERVRRWASRLEGVPAPVAVAPDRPRSLSWTGATVPVEVDEPTSAALRRLAERSGATAYVVLLAGLQLLLAADSGQRDVVVGSPVAGRHTVEDESLIGCFINTVVVRTRVDPEQTGERFVAEVREAALTSFTEGDVPLEPLVRELAPVRDPGAQPLFRVMLTVHNQPRPPLVLPGVTARPLQVDTGGAKCDLALSIVDDAGPLRGELTYRDELYREATAHRVVRAYLATLRALATGPEQTLSTIMSRKDTTR